MAVKNINIKNHTYCFFSDMIILKKLLKFAKIRQKILEKHWIHHIRKIDYYTDIYSENSFYLIIHRTSGCFSKKTEINT